jgi:hypothetical protein
MWYLIPMLAIALAAATPLAAQHHSHHDWAPVPATAGYPFLIGTETTDKGELLAVACSAGIPRILIQHRYLGGGISHNRVNVRYGFDDSEATFDTWTLSPNNRATLVPAPLTRTLLAEMTRSARLRIRLVDPPRGTIPGPDGGTLVLDFSLLGFGKAKQYLPCL